MNVDVRRKGQKVHVAFTSDGSLVEPSLERFAASISVLVNSLREGDEVDCAFDRLGHLPLVSTREIDRLVRRAQALHCSLLLQGLPSEIASIYSDYTTSGTGKSSSRGRTSSSRRRRSVRNG